MAVNTLTDVLMLTPETEVRDGFLSVRLLKQETEAALPILKGLALHLRGLQEEYPDYIQFERGAL